MCSVVCEFFIMGRTRHAASSNHFCKFGHPQFSNSELKLYCTLTSLGLFPILVSNGHHVRYTYSTNHVYLHRFSHLRFCVCV